MLPPGLELAQALTFAFRTSSGRTHAALPDEQLLSRELACVGWRRAKERAHARSSGLRASVSRLGWFCFGAFAAARPAVRPPLTPLPHLYTFGASGGGYLPQDSSVRIGSETFI